MTIDQKPILHGRDHSPGGADPIPDLTGGIDFDVDNEGGWLFVQANDDTEAGGAIFGYAIDFRDRSSSGNGIRLDTFNALTLKAAGQASLLSTAGRVVIQSDYSLDAFEAILITAPSGSIEITAGDDFNIQSSGAAAVVQGTAAGILALNGNAGVEVTSGSDIELISDTVIRFESPAGTTLLEVRSDGTFHILTGAAWVADL